MHIPDQTGGVCTLFQSKKVNSVPYFRLEMLENDTLWGGTYLYGLYMGVPPPLPGSVTLNFNFYLQSVEGVEEIHHERRGLIYDEHSEHPADGEEAGQHSAAFGPKPARKRVVIFTLQSRLHGKER